jgi:hypothetical protein
MPTFKESEASHVIHDYLQWLLRLYISVIFTTLSFAAFIGLAAFAGSSGVGLTRAMLLPGVVAVCEGIGWLGWYLSARQLRRLQATYDTERKSPDADGRISTMVARIFRDELLASGLGLVLAMVCFVGLYFVWERVQSSISPESRRAMANAIPVLAKIAEAPNFEESAHAREEFWKLLPELSQISAVSRTTSHLARELAEVESLAAKGELRPNNTANDAHRKYAEMRQNFAAAVAQLTGVLYPSADRSDSHRL